MLTWREIVVKHDRKETDPKRLHFVRSIPDRFYCSSFRNRLCLNQQWGKQLQFLSSLALTDLGCLGLNHINNTLGKLSSELHRNCSFVRWYGVWIICESPDEAQQKNLTSPTWVLVHRDLYLKRNKSSSFAGFPSFG